MEITRENDNQSLEKDLFNKDTEIILKSYTKQTYFNSLYFNKRKNNLANKIIIFILIFSIIFLLIIVFVLNKKYNNAKSYIKLLKVFKSDKMVQLFLKNKTKLYYEIRMNYLSSIGIFYNDSNPKTFQNKLNYLDIHESPEAKTEVVDKIKIHDYSKRILGKDICVPILKIYNDVNEINLDQLPDKFVLKCNHGSGFNIFCKDKTNFDLEKAKDSLKNWMSVNYGLKSAEFQYLFVDKKIFASPYLSDNMIDYKIYCFTGKPTYIAYKKVIKKDGGHNTYLYNYYYTNWTLSDIELGTYNFKRSPDIFIERPKTLDLMLEYAEKFAKEFVFVRTDFYDINGTVYLGEITFTPSNALSKFKNKEQRLFLGSLIDLTKIKPNFFNK